MWPASPSSTWRPTISARRSRLSASAASLSTASSATTSGTCAASRSRTGRAHRAAPGRGGGAAGLGRAGCLRGAGSDGTRGTGGNPFLVRELARMRAEQPGAAPGTVPGTVLDVTSYRIAQLGPASRDVLRAAAVFGLAPATMEVTDYDADEFYLRS